jgi:hypothetical protein
MRKFDKKTQEELERGFIESYERLVRAGEVYDQGHWGEAPNIAQQAYLFVHDRGKERSILSQLNFKDISFISTTKDPPSIASNVVLVSPEYRLITASIGFDGMDYCPPLSNAKRQRTLPFQDSHNEVVLAWHGRQSIKRGELLEFIRHTEGSHIAPGYHQRFAKMAGLMRGDWVDGHMEINGSPPLMPEPYAPAYATVRQIGWELEESLRRGCAALVASAKLRPKLGPRMKLVPQTS